VPDAGWVKARHWMNDLAGKPNVRLRIVYGSDGTSLSQNEGFAFDNIWIGEKKRRVLVEHFTSSSGSNDLASNALVYDLMKGRKPAAVIDLQYHLNLNGSDPFYSVNPDDPNGRLFYYGVLQAPYSFIDGGEGGKFNFIGSNKPGGNDLDNRSLVDPLFELKFTHSLSGQNLVIHGVLKATETIEKTIVSVQTAIVEPKVLAAGWADTVRNVVRKLLPTAAGTTFNRAWSAGDSVTFDLSWNITNVTYPDDMVIVMFAQNYSSREVYQVATNDNTAVPTGFDQPVIAGSANYRLFPNPARDHVVIALDEPAQQESELAIIDLIGRTVFTRMIQQGERYFELEVSGLPRGMYLVKTGQPGAPVKRMILTE
jgi:hypothetical protein